MGLHQILNILHSLKNHQNDNGTDGMGEYICQWYIGQGFNLQNI